MFSHHRFLKQIQVCVVAPNRLQTAAMTFHLIFQGAECTCIYPQGLIKSQSRNNFTSSQKDTVHVNIAKSVFFPIQYSVVHCVILLIHDYITCLQCFFRLLSYFLRALLPRCIKRPSLCLLLHLFSSLADFLERTSKTD